MGGFRDFVKQVAAKQKLIGNDFRGWLNNGWSELQEAVKPAFETQVGPGPNATLGTVTMGELTAERLEEQRQIEPELDS